MRSVSSVEPDTRISIYAHLTALHQERDRHDEEVNRWRLRFEQERDRRYAEVSVEREKALKIKELADLRALDLKSEIDQYKDEKANNFREQIGSERGLYATKDDLKGLSDKMDVAIKPLGDFVARSRGGTDKWGQIVIGLGLVMTAIALFLKF